MWPLFSHLNPRQILSIFILNYLKNRMNNFRLNLVKKNDSILLWKYSNFTRPEFYGVFVALALVSATAKTVANFIQIICHYYYYYSYCCYYYYYYL